MCRQKQQSHKRPNLFEKDANIHLKVITFVLSFYCACVLYCLCATAFALVVIARHQRPFQSVPGLCICHPSKTGYSESQLLRLDFAWFALTCKTTSLNLLSWNLCIGWQKQQVCTGSRGFYFLWRKREGDGFCCCADVTHCCKLNTLSSACVEKWTEALNKKWFSKLWRADRKAEGLTDKSLFRGFFFVFFVCWRK